MIRKNGVDFLIADVEGEVKEFHVWDELLEFSTGPVDISLDLDESRAKDIAQALRAAAREARGK